MVARIAKTPTGANKSKAISLDSNLIELDKSTKNDVLTNDHNAINVASIIIMIAFLLTIFSTVLNLNMRRIKKKHHHKTNACGKKGGT